MSSVPSFGKLDSRPGTVEAPRQETPFRLALLGDYSGRANRGVTGDLGGRKSYKIHHSTLDEILARLAPALTMPVPNGDPAALSFASLDDFHPDEVFDKVEPFRDLNED